MFDPTRYTHRALVTFARETKQRHILDDISVLINSRIPFHFGLNIEQVLTDMNSGGYADERIIITYLSDCDNHELIEYISQAWMLEIYGGDIYYPSKDFLLKTIKPALKKDQYEDLVKDSYLVLNGSEITIRPLLDLEDKQAWDNSGLMRRFFSLPESAVVRLKEDGYTSTPKHFPTRHCWEKDVIKHFTRIDTKGKSIPMTSILEAFLEFGLGVNDICRMAENEIKIGRF